MTTVCYAGSACISNGLPTMFGSTFPSYALGAVAAAQLFQAAERETPAIRQRLAQGDGTLLLQWLRTNVHAHGSLLPTVELLRQATGRGFDAGALVAHLRRRYLDRAT